MARGRMRPSLRDPARRSRSSQLERSTVPIRPDAEAAALTRRLRSIEQLAAVKALRLCPASAGVDKSKLG